jgi:hypothetical protein
MGDSDPRQLQYLHDTIDLKESKYQNQNILGAGGLVLDVFRCGTQATMVCKVSRLQPSTRQSLRLTNEDKSKASEVIARQAKPVARLLGLGFLSVASAIAGGLTVAWWYRKTLSRLQNPIASGLLPKTESVEEEVYSISVEEPSDPSPRGM